MSGSASNKECFNNAKDGEQMIFSRMMRGGNISLRSGASSFFNHTASLRIIQNGFVLLMIRIIALDRINLVVALVLRFPDICKPLLLYIDIRSTKASIINNNSLQRSWRQHKLEVNLNQNVPACLWKLL